MILLLIETDDLFGLLNWCQTNKQLLWMYRIFKLLKSPVDFGLLIHIMSPYIL